MNPSVSGIVAGKSQVLTSRVVSDHSRPLPIEEPNTPVETVQLGQLQAPGAQSVPSPTIPPGFESTADELPTPIVAESPGAPLPSSPTSLLLEEQPVSQPETASAGMTFAQMAKSATAALGKTVQHWLGGDPLAELRQDVQHINELEVGAKLLKTPGQFAAKTAEFKQRLANGESLESIRDEAYAVAREAASQTSGMRAFDCQILGALAMNHGHIAEMRTGEGKTLTAVMPLYLNALAGKGAHLITVNEALAKRDSEWMGPVFERLGMKVGLVLDEQTPEQKRDNYNCDITYLTDRTLGFDYLHDQTATDPSQRVQRGHFFALVDEVDEVMLDEARTPMILSVQGKAASPDYKVFADIVKDLVPGEDYQVDLQQSSVWLTDGGLRFVENELALKDARQQLELVRPESPKALEAETRIDQCLVMRPLLRQENKARKALDDEDAKKPNAMARMIGMSGEYDAGKAKTLESLWKQAEKAREEAEGETGAGLYSEENAPRVHYLDACLKAQVLQVEGKHYSVEGGEIKIIDQNKGRVSDGKRFSNGLHQALEAKEGVEVRPESRTAASITLPELFNTYQRKSGMTGTGKTSETEFNHFYGLSVVEIPTNKPVLRKDQADVVFCTLEAKEAAVVDEAVKSAMSGRPVLIGTLSVNANKAIAARLLQAGFPPDRLQVLNAETARSSEDVYEDNAGLSGAITLATGERADKVVADPLNFKKMAQLCGQALAEGKGVVVDVESSADAEQLEAWLSGTGAEVSFAETAVPSAPAGKVVIRVASTGKTDPGSMHLDAAQYRVEKRVLDVDPGDLDTTIQEALQAYQEGQPVVLRCKSAHGLSAAAERLMDAGLGLESLPLVCDGKEKENLLVERAGRAGFITVATNMAGRGADIKPDAFDYDKVAEHAYEAAKSSTGGIVLDVEKDSQALKLLRRLQGHCPVTIAEKPEQTPAPGQILLRCGKELPPTPDGVSQIKASDYATHGLYVIGTERAGSRRIDDQLIGRAGRQGAEGESRFFLSLSDDLLKLSTAHGLGGLVKAMGGDKAGVSNPIVSQQVAETQRHSETESTESRCKSDRLEEVMRTQREAYFGFRDELVESPGDELTKEYIADFACSGLTEQLREKLGAKSRYSGVQVMDAVDLLRQSTGIPLELTLSPDQRVDRDSLESLLLPSISNAIANSNLAPGDWKAALLYTADQGWQDQLEAMEMLRDAAQLEGMAGKKPEEVYALRGFSTYENMVASLRRKVATELLPLLLRRSS